MAHGRSKIHARTNTKREAMGETQVGTDPFKNIDLMDGKILMCSLQFIADMYRIMSSPFTCFGTARITCGDCFGRSSACFSSHAAASRMQLLSALLILIFIPKCVTSFVIAPPSKSIPVHNVFKARVPSRRRPSCLSRPLNAVAAPSGSMGKGKVSPPQKEKEVDVVVIGSGIGGLSCAALPSKYNLLTVCVEAHDTPGGCAHSFSRYSTASKTRPFQFDSGPSLISGVSSMGTNPLRQVLDAIGTADDIQWCNYDGWLIHDYADGKTFKLTTGNAGEFENAIEEKSGLASRRAFERFKEKMLERRGLSEVSAYIPPFALRGGLSTVASLLRYLFKLLSIGTKGTILTGPFTECMDLYGLHDAFIRKWFDYLAFALSGLDAAHTQAAPVAYTMSDLHKPGAVLDYPMGGMDSLIQALIKGMEKHGGQLQLNSRVERLLLHEKNGAACCSGVVLDDGTVIRARKGVVSNAPLWNMARILEDSVDPTSPVDCPVKRAVNEVRKQADSMEMTGSFMHLHIGIPKDGLGELECHHSILNFNEDVTAEQNLVIVSIPTVFDPSLAPDGYHVVHAYTAASENFDDWAPFLEGKEESGKVGYSPNAGAASKYNRDEGYKKLKAEKAEALWKAVECVIPDVRERAELDGSVVLVGTPLTHRRYNQRARGTYGPAPSPGKDVWELPGPLTPIKGLLACGDTTFPGIGLPGVAASGTIAANTLVSVRTQMKLMDELKEMGALQ